MPAGCLPKLRRFCRSTWLYARTAVESRKPRKPSGQRSIRWQPESISADFDERLYARITAEERRTFWSRIFGDRLSWKPALPLAAGCATMLLAVIVSIPGPAPVPTPVQEVRVEAIEPEQLERAVEDMEMLRQFSTPGQVQTL